MPANQWMNSCKANNAAELPSNSLPLNIPSLATTKLMNKLLLIILMLLSACSEPSKQARYHVVIDEVEETANVETAYREPASPENKVMNGSLLSLFPQYHTDSISVKVVEEARYGSLEESGYIPLDKQKYFEGFLYSQYSSTGAKPLGRLRIGEHSHLLTLYQLDDYGPVYYGMTYDEKADKIISKEIIAQEWGDAGDSQTIKSNIYYQDGQVQLIKRIETCHLDIETVGIDPEDAEVDCTDSVAVVKVNKKLEFEKMK
jgi:hypothetical protein